MMATHIQISEHMHWTACLVLKHKARAACSSSLMFQHYFHLNIRGDKTQNQSYGGGYTAILNPQSKNE